MNRMFDATRPLFSHYDRLIMDSLTEAGALLLADVIRCYWREKGHPAPVMKVEYFTVKGKGSLTPYVPGGCFAVRSDMVGGLPRGK